MRLRGEDRLRRYGRAARHQVQWAENVHETAVGLQNGSVAIIAFVGAVGQDLITFLWAENVHVEDFITFTWAANVLETAVVLRTPAGR